LLRYLEELAYKKSSKGQPIIKAATVRTGERSLSPRSRRKIRDARYLVGEDRFIVTFDSGKVYSFPRSSLEVDDGSELVNIQLDRRRFFCRVTQVSGNRYEIPWDRVLHEAEPAYAYFRGRTGRTKTTRAIGSTIRKLRKAKGPTPRETRERRRHDAK